MIVLARIASVPEDPLVVLSECAGFCGGRHSTPRARKPFATALRTCSSVRYFSRHAVSWVSVSALRGCARGGRRRTPGPPPCGRRFPRGGRSSRRARRARRQGSGRSLTRSPWRSGRGARARSRCPGRSTSPNARPAASRVRSQFDMFVQGRHIPFTLQRLRPRDPFGGISSSSPSLARACPADHAEPGPPRMPRRAVCPARRSPTPARSCSRRGAQRG